MSKPTEVKFPITKENVDDWRDVLDALAKGKEIEMFHDGRWHVGIYIAFKDTTTTRWRVKPEPLVYYGVTINGKLENVYPAEESANDKVRMLNGMNVKCVAVIRLIEQV